MWLTEIDEMHHKDQVISIWTVRHKITTNAPPGHSGLVTLAHCQDHETWSRLNQSNADRIN